MEISSKLGSYKAVSRAAKLLIQRYKTPAEFLDAACTQLSHLSEHYGYMQDYHHNRDHTYTLTFMLKEIIPAWYQGGSRPVDAITKAIYSVMNQSGAEGFAKTAMDIMGAHGTYAKIYEASAEAWYVKLGSDFASLLLDMGEIVEEVFDGYLKERRESVN